MNGFDNGVSGNGYAIMMRDGTANSAGNNLMGLYGGVAVLNSGSSFSANNLWYHVVLVRTSGVTKFFLNGIQTANTFTNNVNTPSGTLRIGSQNGIRFFNGSIDEVKIYNVALTAAQVQTEFLATQAQKPGSGNAISFDGVNVVVAVQHTAALNFPADLTVETWIKIPSNTVSGSIVEKWGGNNLAIG